MSNPIKEPFRGARGHQDQDRDVFVDKRTPSHGAPEFVAEEVTGSYEGEELAAIRARRPTPTRFKKLEEFKDEITKDVGSIKLSIVRIESRNETTSQSLTNIEQHLSDLRHRQRIEHEAEVAVETAEKVAGVAIGEAKEKDALDAKAARRKLRGQIVAAALGGGAVLKVLHWFGVM